MLASGLKSLTWLPEKRKSPIEDRPVSGARLLTALRSKASDDSCVMLDKLPRFSIWLSCSFSTLTPVRPISGARSLIELWFRASVAGLKPASGVRGRGLTESAQLLAPALQALPVPTQACVSERARLGTTAPSVSA